MQSSSSFGKARLRARVERLRQFFATAIRERDVVTIQYSGGRYPGASREIGPLGVKGRTLRAVCFDSDGAPRNFDLRLVRIGPADASVLQLREGRAVAKRRLSGGPCR